MPLSQTPPRLDPWNGTFIAWNDPAAVAREVLDWDLPKLSIEWEP